MIFLNQLQDFTILDHSYTESNGKKGRKANFHFRHFILRNNWHVYISITDLNITVKVSKMFLKENWNSEYSIFPSKIGIGKKSLKNYRLQEHVRFSKLFILIPTSLAILQQQSFLLFNKSDFSKVFKYFCKKIKIFGYPLNDDTLMLNEFINLFLIDKKFQINSFSDLEKLGMKGLFKLAIKKQKKDSKLETFSKNDELFDIIAGVFIMPQAFELLKKFDDEING